MTTTNPTLADLPTRAKSTRTRPAYGHDALITCDRLVRIFTTDGSDTNIVPVDLKSGSEPDDTLQLGTYSKFVRSQWGISPQYATYWMARTGATTAMHPMGRFTDAHLDYLYGNARRGMEAGIFLPKVSRMCAGCSVRDSCVFVGGENAAEFSPLS